MPARALAHEEPLRPTGKGEDAFVHERVVEDQIRPPETQQGFSRQEFRIARPGADKRHMSDHGHDSFPTSLAAELAEFAETKFSFAVSARSTSLRASRAESRDAFSESSAASAANL